MITLWVINCCGVNSIISDYDLEALKFLHIKRLKLKCSWFLFMKVKKQNQLCINRPHVPWRYRCRENK